MDDPAATARLQRRVRIVLGAIFAALGLFMTAAAVIGFDGYHASWQDSLVFLLPLPWLVCSMVILRYRPAARVARGRASPTPVSPFSNAIKLAVFAGLVSGLYALDWIGVVHAVVVTAGAVAALLLLARMFAKAPSP